MKKSHNTNRLLAIIATAVGATTAFGANWTGAGADSDWFNALNWNTGTVPNAVAANISGNYIVNYSGADSSVSGFELDLATLNILSGKLSFTSGGDIILAGRNVGTTYLNINNGGSFAADAAKTVIVGYQKNSNGYITVETGGTLSVKTSATSSNDGILGIGYAGYGKLDVKGGTVKASNIRIGNSVGGTGLLEISSGTVSAARTMHIGNIGATGTLEMSGGTITSWYLYLGSNVASDGTTAKGYVNLTGGTINATLGTTIGGESGAGANYGEFNISGGAINTGTAYIGKNSQSQGVLNLDGGSFNATSIYAAYGSGTSAVINLEDGGLLRANTIYLGYGATGTAVLNINGTTGKILKKTTETLADIGGGSGSGIVRFNHDGTLAFQNKTTGTNLKIEHLGSGTTTLDAANTHGGGTIVKNGTVIAAHTNALGGGDFFQ